MARSPSEPSIDEILSSIRRVIAEDDAIDLNAPKQEPLTSAKHDAVADQETKDDSLTDDSVLELTTEETSQENADESLMDQSTAQGLRQGLSTLAALSEPAARPQIVRSGETSLEGLVTEMLRPMMKEWLDQNLPDLVESMVEREIQRITKKG